jgi:7-cyano-7-deazaguanine reductase
MVIENTVVQTEESELGKKSEYDPLYNPEKLFSIPRKEKRDEMGINSSKLPFYGFDCWNHYEVSWLDENGKPIVGLAEIIYGSDSPNIIESKSMKLYFNSLNNTNFKDVDSVQSIVKDDLEKNVGAEVFVNIIPLYDLQNENMPRRFDGESIDYLTVRCEVYNVDSSFLFTENDVVEEILYSDLLKSNCRVTNQPDWGSIQISYKGKKINREGLLKYLVSFRNHNEFHEECIERIFVDIMHRCHPTELTVYGRYTRRGGLDINPYRSTKKITDFKKNQRLYRQ